MLWNMSDPKMCRPVVALPLAALLSWFSGQVAAMDCANLLEQATNLDAPVGVSDANARSSWSSDPAPFMDGRIKSVVNFSNIPEHFLYLDSSVEVCASKGCVGQLFSSSHGYSFYSPVFDVNNNSVVFSWVGYTEVSNLLNFSDVTADDARRQVGSYLSFENTDFQTLYAVGVEIRQIDEWLSFGGPGFGAIPLKLFSSIPTSTTPGCSP